MDPTTELIWRELYTHAGPSSAIPFLTEDSFKSIGVDAPAIESGISELMGIGAVVPLTGDELSRLANHKRIGGEFVSLTRSGRSSHLRIIDPTDLKQSIAAQTEALFREMELLRPKRISLPTPCTEEKLTADKIIRDLETGSCWYEVPNLFRLSKPKMGDENPFELHPIQLIGTASKWLVQQINAHGITMNQNGTYVLPSGEVLKAVLTELLLNVKMDLMIVPAFQAINDRCDYLEAMLGRLSRFAVPTWATVDTEDSSRRERIPKGVMQEVWRRDQGRCAECGSKENLEFDHIIPWAKGGSGTARNIQLLCEVCNRKKSDRM